MCVCVCVCVDSVCSRESMDVCIICIIGCFGNIVCFF